MSKFIKGDIVDVPWFNEQTTRGIVHASWGRNVNVVTGVPRVEIFLLDEGFVGYFDEDTVELALDEYEFMAVEVDQEDFYQTSLGSGWEWATLEYAQKQVQDELTRNSDYYSNNKDVLLQINRRRKAGLTIGHKAYR